MSILKRPGWANYEVVNEGRLHNDKLKDKIGRIFDRLSLGYSPNHVIDKIASVIRKEKGEKFNLDDISNEYIIDIANSDFVTRGKFTPSLKSSFAAEYQNTNNATNSIDTPSDSVSINFSTPTTTQDSPVETSAISTSVIPSEDSEDEKYSEDGEEYSEDAEDGEDAEDSKDKEYSEDAEEVKTCKCHEKDSAFNPETSKKYFDSKLKTKSLENKAPTTQKESVKLSPKAVNQLLKESYIKQKQHLTRIEERYRIF